MEPQSQHSQQDVSLIQVRFLHHESDETTSASGVIVFVALTALFFWCCGPSILQCINGFCLRDRPSATNNNNSRWPYRGPRRYGTRMHTPNNNTNNTPTTTNLPTVSSSTFPQLFALRANSEDILTFWRDILGHDAAAATTTSNNGATTTTTSLEAWQQQSRKRYIELCLITKIYKPEAATDSEKAAATAVDGSDTAKTNDSTGGADERNPSPTDDSGIIPLGVDRPQHDAVLGLDDDDYNRSNDPCCAICLGLLEEGDEIAVSPNSGCNHVFHKDCITAWLLKKEECPCCRQRFLPTDCDAGMAQLGFPHPPPPVVEHNDDTATLLRGLETLFRLGMEQQQQRTETGGLTTTTTTTTGTDVVEMTETTTSNNNNNNAATTPSAARTNVAVDLENQTTFDSPAAAAAATTTTTAASDPPTNSDHLSSGERDEENQDADVNEQNQPK